MMQLFTNWQASEIDIRNDHGKNEVNGKGYYITPDPMLT